MRAKKCSQQKGDVSAASTSNWPNNSRRLLIAEPVGADNWLLPVRFVISCRETSTVNRASSARLPSQCLTFALGVVEHFLQSNNKPMIERTSP